MSRTRYGLLALAVLLGAGCDDAATSVEVGSVEVSTVWSGTVFDADGYVVLVDGVEETTLSVGGVVSLILEAGTYSVELTDIDAPCVVSSDNPVSVTVMDDQTVPVSFDVTC